MTTRAILVNFRKYTHFGGKFYEPILDFFIKTMSKYQDEFDMLYLLDSLWDIGSVKESWEINKVKIIKINEHLRYYDAYKAVLPQVKEDLVLFLDNDTVIYKKDIISSTFDKLREYDVVSIIDTIGTMKVPLKKGNKACPYFFAAKKDVLMKYLDVDWGPNAMPYTETFGLLTEAFLKDGHRIYELEEDKGGVYLEEGKDSYLIKTETGKVWEKGYKGKDLGYYHIRSGSLPAYLLATKKYGDKKTYESYINNQPKREYIRQFAWYSHMLAMTEGQHDSAIFNYMDNLLVEVFPRRNTTTFQDVWIKYCLVFKKYHGL